MNLVSYLEPIYLVLGVLYTLDSVVDAEGALLHFVVCYSLAQLTLMTLDSIIASP